MTRLKALKLIALLMSFIMAFTATSPAFASQEVAAQFELAHISSATERSTVTPNFSLGNITIGDVDNSGCVTIADAVLLSRYLSGGEVPINRRAADISLSGEITADDVHLLLKWLAGHDITLGHQPGSLTIIPYDNLGNPVYQAEFELLMGGERLIYRTNTGIISIPNINPESVIQLSANTANTPYEFLRWEVSTGYIEISPFEYNPSFVLPQDGAVLIAIFESVAEYYFCWDIPVEWIDDFSLAAYAMQEMYTSFALGSDIGTLLETQQSSPLELNISARSWFQEAYTGGPEYPNNIVSNVPWITINYIQIQYLTNRAVYLTTYWFTVAENNGEIGRTGIIRAYYPSGLTREILIVNQGAGPALRLSGNVWYPSSAASSAHVDVTTSPGPAWNLFVSHDWITVSNINPPYRTGNGSFRIHASENTENADRVGMLLITTPRASSQFITVTQAAANSLTLSRSTWPVS